MLFPKKTKYKKQFKNKCKGKISKINNIIYGKYAIKSLEETRLTAKQIEATRKTIIKKMKKSGFIWIRIFPDIPVTSKPTENRMGKGKGAFSHWISKVKKGQILYEINGVSLESAKKILQLGSNKLPVKTKFIYK